MKNTEDKNFNRKADLSYDIELILYMRRKKSVNQELIEELIEE